MRIYQHDNCRGDVDEIDDDAVGDGVNDGNGGGGDFVGDDGDTNLATKHDTTLGSGSVA